MDTFLDTKTIQSLKILIQWLSSTQTLSSERKRKNKESNSDFVQQKTGNYVKSYRNAVQLLFRELVEKSPVLPFQGLWLRKKKSLRLFILHLIQLSEWWLLLATDVQMALIPFFSWGEELVSTLHKVLLLGLHMIFKYQLRTAYCFQYQIEQHGVSKV